MKNSTLIIGIAMIIAGILMPFLSNLIARKHALPDSGKGLVMGLGIGLLFWGSRMIVRYRNMTR